MALPNPKPELHEDGFVADNTGEKSRAAPEQTYDVSAHGQSPARYLQARIAEELSVPKGPSIRSSLSTILILCLAISVAVLSLYSLGWV